MKANALAVACMLQVAAAHYTFDSITVNGLPSAQYQFVLPNTRSEEYMPTKFINSFGVTPLDQDFRCNEGAFTNMGATDVAYIQAGDSVDFVLALGAKIVHPGPSQVYMSRAPGSAKDYDGSGDWFKIYQEDLCGDTSDGIKDEDWCATARDRVTITIPATTPPGDYLIRAEHIGLHGAFQGEAEFYYACALVNINGPGGGIPGPLVKIPGVHQPDDPSVNFDIYNNPTSYSQAPGPEVWMG